MNAQVFIPFGFNKGNTPLTINPLTPFYILVDDLATFTATCGMGTYTCSNTVPAQADNASITSNNNGTADYVARSTAHQTDTVTLSSPGYSNISTTVTTYNSLTLNPTNVTVGVNLTQTFTSTGGCLNGTNCTGGSATFSMVSGLGSINPTTGVYTAPSSVGTAVIQVTDSIGNIVTANIIISNNLQISPTTLRLPVFSTNTFTTILGTTPYTYSVFSGTGIIGSASGIYTAPSMIGSAIVQVTDSTTPTAGTSDSAVSIIRPIDVQTGQYFACALYDEGSVKCWGWNSSGQLGIGNTNVIGDVNTEVGGLNQFVSLGTGRTAKKISVGVSHVCAILDNDLVKCWGAGGSGRLGNGTTNNRGDGANEMSDFLPYTDLGTGRTAVKLVGGLDYTCALLDDSSIKCWGENQRGQLGKDSTLDLGDGAGEMGDGLATVNIGAGRTALDIVGLYETVCILRDNSTIICWGRGNLGALGNGGTANIGDGLGEMAAINAINLGAGFGTVSKIYGLGRSVCAEDTLNVVKCWGYNAFGQLLLGNTTNRTTPSATATLFGTGLVISKLSGRLDALCALFTNNRIKCFGRARTGTVGQITGVLLNGSPENSLGDIPSETDNGLPYVNH